MFRVVVGLSKLRYHEEDTSIYFWKASSHAIDRLCTLFIKISCVVHDNNLKCKILLVGKCVGSILK